MAILTYADVRGYGLRVLNESVKLANARTRRETKDVFLSHSSKDKEHLAGVIAFLEEHGASVYVDAGDTRLPQTPNPQTAVILKSEIHSCPRFVLLVSPNSKDSRWIPWELGLADGTKGMATVASLPIADSAENQYWIRGYPFDSTTPKG